MIRDWNEAQDLITDFNREFNQTVYKIESDTPIKEEVCTCMELDKPLKVFTGQDIDISYKDEGEFYSMYFGQGERFPEDKIGLAWLCDTHSILFFERPYTGKLIKLIKKLLPNENVEYQKNDVCINGTKNGTTIRTGYQHQIGDYNNAEEITESEPLSGMICLLRWDDLDGLNEEFKDNAHHQERLNDKAPLSTLSDFIKNVSKEEFIEMLEEKNNWCSKELNVNQPGEQIRN